MKLKLMTLSAMTLFLFSCQKETGGGNGGGTNNNTLLTKIVNKTGNDSTTTTFSYNSSQKLTQMRFDGEDDNGAPVDLIQNLVRNSANIVQRVVLKSNQFSQVGIDSIVYNMNYNAGSSRYTSRVAAIEIMGFTIMDSIAIIYDAGGRITSEIDYVGDPVSGYEQAAKTEYTYNGANLTSIKLYSFDATTNQFTLEQTNLFEYDSKTAPLILSTEGIAVGLPQFFSVNNYTKNTLTSATDPSLNDVETTTYTYNAQDKPLTAATTTQSGQNSTSRFYYQ
jgi:hypothetical protein